MLPDQATPRLRRQTPSQITQDEIVAYLDTEDDVSDSTRMNIIGALRVFFRDFLDRDVMDAFEMPSTTTKRRKPLRRSSQTEGERRTCIPDE